MSPPKKAPDAVTPRATRLEMVRVSRAGKDSLHEFWKEIRDELPAGARSYEAIRNYHFDRDAPIDYYVAISRAYGVSLHWLLTGEGGMDQVADAVEGRDPKDPGAEKFANALMQIPGLAEGRHDYRSMFGHSLLDLLRVSGMNPPDSTEEELTAVGAGLWDLEKLVWWIINGPEPDEGGVRFPVYALSMQSAIRTAIPRSYSSEDAAWRSLKLLANLPHVFADLANEVLGEAAEGIAEIHTEEG